MDGTCAEIVIALDEGHSTTAGDGEALRATIVGAMTALQKAHTSFAGAPGRIVVVHRDPTQGSIAARAAAGAARSLVGSLAVEWAPSTTFARVATAPDSDEATIAAACRYAADAPAGTVVELSGTGVQLSGTAPAST